MPLPMTISDARALQDADLDVGDEAIATAEAEAREAAELVAALERAAIESDKKPTSGAAAAEAKQLADFAAKRLQRTRDRADQAKAARRLLALEAVGNDVDQIHASAAQPDAGMVAAMKQIADAHATLQRLAAAHNDSVREVITRARELGAEPAAPSGPRASSAHVMVARGSRKIQSGNAIVQMVDKRTMADAVEFAIKGDTDAAVRRLSAAHTVAAPVPADRYYVLGNGGVHAAPPDPWDRNFTKKVASGEARILTADERGAWLDGRFDGHQTAAQKEI